MNCAETSKKSKIRFRYPLRLRVRIKVFTHTHTLSLDDAHRTHGVCCLSGASLFWACVSGFAVFFFSFIPFAYLELFPLGRRGIEAVYPIFASPIEPAGGPAVAGLLRAPKTTYGFLWRLDRAF
jgi:hypothetical protein